MMIVLSNYSATILKSSAFPDIFNYAQKLSCHEKDDKGNKEAYFKIFQTFSRDRYIHSTTQKSYIVVNEVVVAGMEVLAFKTFDTFN